MLDHSNPLTKMTRDSCLECCEKHLGAALVLMAEHRDGYPHRLRAIGHLHEAEDETQAWPALHDALREARKAYQVEGDTPDVAALMARIAEVRAGTDSYAAPAMDALEHRASLGMSDCSRASNAGAIGGTALGAAVGWALLGLPAAFAGGLLGFFVGSFNGPSLARQIGWLDKDKSCPVT